MLKARKLVAAVSVTTLSAMGFVALAAAPVSASGACPGATPFANNDTADVGSVSNPYQIATAEQLQYMALEINAGRLTTANKFFRVTEDLDFNGCDFTPNNLDNPFSGEFDGGSKTISNYVVTGDSYVGLFGFTTGAAFKDIVIENATVTGSEEGQHVGALVGSVTDRFQGSSIPTTFENITVKYSGITGGSLVGGIAGSASNGSGNSINGLRVLNSIIDITRNLQIIEPIDPNDPTITMELDPLGIGGLFGQLSGYPTVNRSGFYFGLIERFSGSEFQDLKWGGGLVGFVGNNFTMNEVAFVGSIDLALGGTEGTGFLIGKTANSSTVTINNSYVDATIRAMLSNRVSGIVGESASTDDIVISNSYVAFTAFDADTTDLLSAHPFSSITADVTRSFYNSDRHSEWSSEPAGAAKTSEQLESVSTFTDWSITADFAVANADTPPSELWYLDPNVLAGFPVLMWEYRAGIHPEPCEAGTFSATGKNPCTAASPGRYVDTSGATAETLCPAGSFQPNSGATGCINAQIGFFVGSEGQTSETQCEAGTTTTTTGATACVAISSGSPPASGGGVAVLPAPSVEVSAGSVVIGETAVLTGTNMSSVTSVIIAGTTVTATCTATSCSFVVPAATPAGVQAVTLVGGFGSEVLENALTVLLENGAAEDQDVAVWTKKVSDTQIKLYAKNIVAAGKVVFMVNGKERAWVRAVDASDPKLRNANGFSYLVRTVNLVKGQKNVMEIYVDGERLRRAAYTLR